VRTTCRPRVLMRSFVTVAISCWIAAAPVAAQTATGSAPPRIVTSGEGEIRVVPDRATIFVGVQSRATTAAAAAADNAKKQSAVLEALRGLGLGSDQLS